ncbi:hypothetical protein P280DRAFT_549756, partial [Massarina eburnea CBS 473.64]
MLIFFFVWLLAALSSTVIAGPVPALRPRMPFYPYQPYANSSSKTFTPLGPALPKTSTSIPSRQVSRPSSTLLNTFSSSINTSSADPLAEANTAVIVQPIDKTVLTSTQAAITFFDPKGKPLITQAETTILQTSYLTKPKTTSSTKLPSSSSTASPSQASTTQKSVSSSPTKLIPSSTASATPISPSRVIGNTTTAGPSYTSPQFTYSPKENETKSASTIATPTAKTQNLNSTTTTTLLSTSKIQPSSNIVQ